MDINAKIAELILRAQNASDGGKCIKDIVSCTKRSRRDNGAGYKRKDTLIISAIELIRRNRCNFTFSVMRDRQRIAKVIVYFETVIEGTKFQVSFHSYDDRLLKYIGGRYARWDKKSSLDSAVYMYQYYNPNGKYLGYMADWG